MNTDRSDYRRRVNRAIDYVLQDLTRPLKLDEVAQAGALSPFHFHRVFKAMLGETLHQFAKRQRLERALYMMSHAPGRSLTDVALRCGFASSSDFSRSFRQQYGVAPGRFDLDTLRDANSTAFAGRMAIEHGAKLTAQPAGVPDDGFDVQIRDVPARTVAYIRVFDPYRKDAVRSACDELLLWARERGLADNQWLGYMWDEPEVVGTAACRYDVALVVDHVDHVDHVVPDAHIGRFDFPPMRVATVTVRGDIGLETRAIDWLYTTWLPESGYVPDDQPMFEEWIGRPYAHGDAYFELVCMLPVVRA